MPKISVIVAAYNVGTYIKECIKSILDQTLRDIQVIIVNDGSTDNTGLVCKNCCGDDKRIVYVETENRGSGAARNTGIEKADGEWLCFVDGDDYLPENALEILYSNIGDADIIVGNYYTDKVGKIKGWDFFSKKVSNHDKKSTLFLIGNALGCSYYGAEYSANIGVPWGKLYNKEFVRGVVFPPLKRMQDTVFNITLFLKNPKLLYINSYVYYYRIVGNSAVRGYRPDFDAIAASILHWLEKPVKENANNKIAELYKFKQLSLLWETIRLSYAHPQCKLKFKEKIQRIRMLCEDKSIDKVLASCDKKILSRKQYWLLSLLVKKQYALVYLLCHYRMLMKL